ncbi:MAG: hypothetical protein M3Z85_10170 [Acidobacteriota bacterium]|nr:hypothetical protein [Acidobacteriota bacterium]
MNLITKKRALIAVAALAILGTLLYFYGGHQVPPGQPALSSLTPENVSEIKNAFNSAKSEIRLLLLLSPT